ncbi:YoaK family protein [Kitasatospora sp. NPDC090091]|uniref:YoaK family protein n=1 Tax=Kitasatospora sp. NPDC090091 TaxID=3364081 RepID=UPI0038296F4A
MVTIHRRTDKLPAGALLAAVGGFLDAYTLTRHGVFANLQSGNVVLFCVQVTSRHWHAAALRLVPVGAFIIGVLAVELLGTPRAVTIVRRPIRLVLTIEIALLTMLATLPGNLPAPVTTVTVSFVAALQFSTFTTLHGEPYATLMTTGNLRQFVVAVHQCLTRRDRRSARRAQLYGVVVGAFSGGALVGVICTRRFGEPAIAVAAGLLVGVLALLIRESRQLERAGGKAPANT